MKIKEIFPQKYKIEIYDISFQTDLNATMRVKIKAKSIEKAKQKLLKEFLSAFDVDY